MLPVDMEYGQRICLLLGERPRQRLRQKRDIVDKRGRDYNLREAVVAEIVRHQHRTHQRIIHGFARNIVVIQTHIPSRLTHDAREEQ